MKIVINLIDTLAPIVSQHCRSAVSYKLYYDLSILLKANFPSVHDSPIRSFKCKAVERIDMQDVYKNLMTTLDHHPFTTFTTFTTTYKYHYQTFIF